MRLSVATKIFLGFAVVIVAFGATSAFTLYRMSELRASVTVLWKELMPMSNQLRGLSRQLKSAEELLALDRNNDVQWLQQMLPELRPFTSARGPGTFDAMAERLDQLATMGDVAEQDAAELKTIAARFRRFATGPALAESIAGLDLPELGPGTSSSDVYDRLVRKTLEKARAGELAKDSPETRASMRVIQRINREVNDGIRALTSPIQAIDRRTEENEREATVGVIIIASAALLTSIIMLVIAQLTLAPIRRLGEGARRIAAGDYAQRVTVKSSDEIGALAAEFNTMAATLEQRDRALSEKQTELLRNERLAVIGKLAAQITHEVRNPLSSIGLNAELLEDELDQLPNPEPSRRSLRAIASEVDRLKAITEEYLQFARLPRPERTPCDVGALLVQFLSFLERELAEAKVKLLVESVRSTADGGPRPVMADAGQLRQALLNVARNALEALRTVPEPRTLTVGLEERADGGVAIRIADDGPGIDPGVRDRLFEPFVTGKSHGTGLGLAMVREIMDEHGGTARAESPLADGRGTAIVLTLPGPAVG